MDCFPLMLMLLVSFTKRKQILGIDDPGHPDGRSIFTG